MADTTFDFSALSDALYNEWEKGMTAWWDQVLDNPAFLGMLGQNMAATSKLRKAYEEALDKGLERAHLPTRGDMIRIARIASLLEDKLLAVEDRVLELADRLDAIEKEALRARVEAAEARVAVLDALARIEAKLDGAAKGDGASATSREKPAAPRRDNAKTKGGEG